MGVYISWMVVDFNYPTRTDNFCNKIEEVPYGRIDLTSSVTSPWSAPHYTATCVDDEANVDIYIYD